MFGGQVHITKKNWPTHKDTLLQVHFSSKITVFLCLQPQWQEVCIIKKIIYIPAPTKKHSEIIKSPTENNFLCENVFFTVAPMSFAKTFTPFSSYTRWYVHIISVNRPGEFVMRLIIPSAVTECTYTITCTGLPWADIVSMKMAGMWYSLS